MLIDISGRTDIVSVYPEWMFRRFEEGYAYSRNTICPNSVRRYELTPDKVDCLLFCSKNFMPVLDRINRITEKFHTCFYYTITAYGKDIEPGIPDKESSIQALCELERIVGSGRIAWRYDPVLLTEQYTVQRHLEIFEWLCGRLKGHVDRCIFSFVEMYARFDQYFPELIPLADEDKEILAEGLGRIAAKYDIPIQTCGNEKDYSKYGIHTSCCVSLEVLGRANNIQFRKLKHKGGRIGCHCMDSRDIGLKDSCTNGCRYCYANGNAARVAENFRNHDPDSPLLIGHLEPTDRLEPGSQKTFLAKNEWITPASG